MQEKNPLFQDFLRFEESRNKIELSTRIQDILDYLQYSIRKENDNLPKQRKLKARKQFVNSQMVNAFGNLNKQQRLEFYINMVNKILGLCKNDPNIVPKQDIVNDKELKVFIRRMRIWKTRKLQIDRKKLVLILCKEEKAHIHDLNNYIFRKSKNNQYFSFVLQAINNKPASKYKTIHIGFSLVEQFSQMFEELRICMDIVLVNFLRENLNLKQSNGLPLNQLEIVHITQETTSKNKDISKEINSSIKPKQFQKIKADNIEDFIVKPKLPSSEINHNLNKLNTKPNQQVKTKQQPPSKKNKIISNKQINQQNEKKINEPFLKNVQNIQNQNSYDYRENRKSITQTLLESPYQIINIQQHIEANKKNIKPNLFNQILPEYQLDDLTEESNMVIIQCEQNRRLLQNCSNKQNFKLFLTIRDYSPQVIFHNVTYLDGFKLWNSEVEEIAVKNLIGSENAAIIYQKIKAYSKIYRARDFVYLRHAFRKKKNIYIVDKSIQNVNYPPFLTIVRGSLRCIWGIIPKDNNICLLVIDVQINNEGYLNQQQNTNLSMQYLRKLFYIQTFITQKVSQNDTKALYKMFDIDNYIQEKEDNNINEKQLKNQRRFKKSINNLSENQIQEKKNIPIRQEKSPSVTTSPSKSDKDDKINEIPNYMNMITDSIAQKNQNNKINLEEQKGEIFQSKQYTPPKINIPQLDSNGFSIVNNQFLKVKHKMIPWQRELIYEDNYRDHHIWKGEWAVDRQKGGMWYVDQKKMSQQKKVLKYIISKIGKNLISGKGILSISLPVDIFCPESNLQRLAMTFAFAPIYLEKAAKMKDPMQQFKQVFVFGITTSLLYLNMQKPFNPILGETFQCSFKGCPVFLEQISHHPPIAAFFMVGRGYKLYGSIESKMQLSLNGGCGINDGDFVVDFQNGNEFRFRTPGGEISGLTYGDRKLNLIGKSYYWAPKLGYLLDVTFNPGKKSFFSLSKQQIPTDYFQGILKKVKKQFMTEFQYSQNKQSPSPKDIIEELFKFTGNWNKQILIDGKKVYDIDNQKYVKLQYQRHPLPSDSNYREDIIYRRLNNVNRSQNEKQKYENIQRKDRTLRGAYIKKK